MEQKDNTKKCFLSEAQLNFMKFWISSNSPLEIINNQFLRLCLNHEIKLPTFTQTYRWTWLEDVFDKLHCLIETKLQAATYVTLIPDCWSDSPNTHYLGINRRINKAYFKI